jgi:hypothetical protein
MAVTPIISLHTSSDGTLRITEDDSRKQTKAEELVGIIPVNYAYAPGDVRRYGAAHTYSASVNDLPFIEAAIASLGANGGHFTGPARVYQIDGTLDIDTLVSPVFGPCNNGSASDGFVLFSDTDAPILRFNTTANRFVSWSNFAVVGTTGGGLTAQHGIVINSAGVRFSNWNVRACGGDGVVVEQCYGGSFRDAYISLCAGDGVRWAGNVGANKWDCVVCAANGGQGFNVDSADGSDHFDTCVSEQNGGAGWYFGTDVEGFTGIHCYSEQNTDGPVVYASASNKNHLHFNSWSDSGGEPEPSNSGGSQNIWSGRKYLSTPIVPRLIQRAFKDLFAVETASVNAIPYDDTIPQSSEGLSVDSLSITPIRTGDLLKVRAWGFFECPAGIAIVTIFKNSATDASFAKALGEVAANKPIAFDFEWQDSATAGSSVAYTLVVGCSAGGTVTFGGTGGSRRFGGVAFGGISIEEFWPSS